MWINERRYGHIVHIEHIARARVVVLRRQHHAVFPKAHISSHIEGTARFPPQIGVGIGEDAKRGGRCAFPRNHPNGIEQEERIIGAYAARIARKTIAGAQFQRIEPRCAHLGKRIEHIPRCRHGGEEAPFVARTKNGRTIGADVARQREQIAVSIFGLCHKGGGICIFITTARTAIGAQTASCQIVETEFVTGEAFHGGVEIALFEFLQFGKEERTQCMTAKGVTPTRFQIAQPVFALEFGAIGLPLCPQPGGEILSVGRGVVGIRAESREAHIFRQARCQSEMGVKIQELILVLFIKERAWRYDL